MYEEHFNLQTLPFGLTPNTAFICELPGHQEAYNTVLFSLKYGEGFIKIVGEVGTGKTLLCRRILNNLPENYISAYIPNPLLTPSALQKAIASELGVVLENNNDANILQAIQAQLIALNQQQKHVVLLIDEAQALSEECLETVRLLTNLETESQKLLQVVLFGQPELDVKLAQENLRQLKQRITFSCHLPTIQKDEIATYLNYRLIQAGYNRSELFTKKALRILANRSRGIPRLINIVAHKAMLVAYGRGEDKVTHRSVALAIRDTEAINHKSFLKTVEGRLLLILGTLSFMLISLLLWVHLQ